MSGASFAMNLFAHAAEPATGNDYAGLRYYQRDACDAIRAALTEHRSALLVMATGTGKTETFGAIARLWPGKVLIIAHRDELIEQARKRLEKMTGEWVEREQGPYTAGLETRIVVASAQTIYQKHRLERFGADHFSLVIVDEAHHYVAAAFRKPIEFFSGAKVLGVTATPDRKDKKAMGQVFDCSPFALDVEDGIEAGYLVPVTGQRIHLDEIDLSHVKASHGDLQAGQLDEAMQKAVEGIVRKTLDLEPTRRAIAFFPGVASAALACEVFNRHKPGSACFLSGKTPDDERDQIVRDFRKGVYQYLCNCNIATEGFDCPDVSLIVQGRPTKSRSLYAQMVGRGTRVLPGVVEHIHGAEGAAARRALIAISPKPDMLILDFVGNSGKHSLCTVEDVLGGKYDQKEIEHARRKSGEAVANTRDSLQAARRELAAMAAAVKAAEVKARVEAFNPFSVLNMPEAEEAVAKDIQLHGFTPANNQQRATLEKFGYKPDELKGVSRRAADKLISESIRRARGGLATYAQLRLLVKYGITDTNVTRARASSAIDYLSKQGWGRKKVEVGPFGQASSRIDPKALHRILHARVVGEEG